MKRLPTARTENIVVQNLNDETLIYNLTTNQAFCLNETSAKVYNHCDGATSFAELKEKYQLTEEIIYLALDKLKEQDLIAGEYVSPFAGMSRREVIKKVGLASMIALPVISTIVAPSAAHAASFAPGSRTFGQTCSNSSNCATSAPYCKELSGGTGSGSQECCRSSDAVVGAGYTYPGRYLKGPNNNICQNCSSDYGQEFCCSGTTKYNNTCTVPSDEPRVVDCSYTCQ